MTWRILPPLVVSLVTLRGSCPGEEPNCKAEPAWLHPPAHLAVFDQEAPLSHARGGSDCPFYQAAWQVFLSATEPVAREDGKLVPRFITKEYFTIEQALGAKSTKDFPKETANKLSLAPTTTQTPNNLTASGDPSFFPGANQAGSVAPAVDQNGNPLFFAIHMNGTMKDFICQDIIQAYLAAHPGASKADAVRGADPTLKFPTGCVELKSAWQIVSPNDPPPAFFVTEAVLPMLKVDPMTHRLITDATHTRTVTVALVALHVVFVLKDHPEFIWSTFEHIGGNGKSDVAPNAPGKPPLNGDPNLGDAGSKYILFTAGTPASALKNPKPDDIFGHFNETTQMFSQYTTPIYRVYPASKSLTNDEDGDVKGVNDSMVADVFKPGALDATVDKRDHYRLVGAVWLDKPCLDFKVGQPFKNTGDHPDPDDPLAIVAGEDRLSSTSMESFTQFDPFLTGVPPHPSGRPNCFSCHDTTEIKVDLVGTTIMGAKCINVSHILSRYLLDAPK